MGLEAEVKPTKVIHPHDALVSRIANALESLANISAANYDLAEKIANEQTSHNAETQRILTEDLAFRHHQIEQYQVVGGAFEFVQALGAIVRQIDGVAAFQSQQVVQTFADIQFIVDDEDLAFRAGRGNVGSGHLSGGNRLPCRAGD